MKVKRLEMAVPRRLPALRSWLEQKERRLGLISSIDGEQLITLVLDPRAAAAELWESPLEADQYPSLTPAIPQCHWFERAVFDLFGLYADGHPRLKGVLLHEEYDPQFQPLRTGARPPGIVSTAQRRHEFLRVEGEGVYELPVGPIHAGIIEPGHFRLSCLGEVILNLEIRLGYLHRGVEKRMTQVPWGKGRFVAEAASSDTAVANALAHAIAIEALLGIEVPARAQFLRSLALEVERIAMHIIDIGGMAVDIGFLGIASSLARMRGSALRLADLLAGSRFMRGFICPGGVKRDPGANLAKIHQSVRQLNFAVEKIVSMFLDSPGAQERLEGVGRVSPSLAREFGLVGVAARGCGIAYDTRAHFEHGTFPRYAPPVVTESAGDALSRIRVRVAELFNSMSFVYNLSDAVPDGPVLTELPENLPPDSTGLGIVEAYRGELIHLAFTDAAGRIKRYVIKDPSFNNWTGLSIAVRNNLVADFPICNKSFSLSYSGHDL
ncbi:MAG TPA: NADH-quinone oxidoreductase subunit C [Candidatus Obscuribacterales bacterium]